MGTGGWILRHWTNPLSAVQRCCCRSTASFTSATARSVFRLRVRPRNVQAGGERRLGYVALPVLHHDGLVGKLDPRTDRKAGTLIINALHEDMPPGGALQLPWENG
jgi:hypothetical protein